MGCDASAFLYFGFTVHDDNDYENDKPACLEDEEDFYATKMGVVDDSGMFNEEGKGKFSLPKDSPEFIEADKKHTAYCERKRKVIDAAGGSIGFYGSDDSQTHFVYLKKFRADWDEAKVVEALPVPTSEELQKFKQYCETMEIPWQEPKWYLAARYF